MKLPRILSILTLLAAASAASAAPECPELEDPPADVCIASAHGVAYGRTRSDAEMGSRALESAAGQFALYFGTEPPAGMLVLSRTYTTEAATALAAAHSLAYGLSWLPASASPWSRPDPSSRRRPGAGRRDPALHEDVLRHELGHAMYAAMFWPGAASETPVYGSPAPDWLDESVAELMESPESQQQRGARFLATQRSSPNGVPPLATFLSMPHPALALQQTMRRNGQISRSGVASLELSPGDRTALALDMFYGQALVFAAFLIEASGDVRVLRDISDATAAGVDFEAWLARRGEASSLPSTLPLLQARWDEWLQRMSERKDPATSG